MKSRSKKILLVLVGIIAVAVIAGSLVTGGEKTTKVQAEKVKVMDIVEEVSASGYVQPQNKVNITSEVTAEIISIPVVDGQVVHRGDLLVQLDTVQLQKDAEQYLYLSHPK